MIKIHPNQVHKILKYFPLWEGFEESFKDDIARGIVFNITDFETGIRYDFMTFKDNDYSWAAFERREKVDFWGVSCYISSVEDLFISKLKWYNISPSEKQMEDLQFLLLDKSLDRPYINHWTKKLNLKTYGLLG